MPTQLRVLFFIIKTTLFFFLTLVSFILYLKESFQPYEFYIYSHSLNEKLDEDPLEMYYSLKKFRVFGNNVGTPPVCQNKVGSEVSKSPASAI